MAQSSIYKRSSQWKLYLLLLALLIVAASLIYTNILAQRISKEERKKVELWANAYKQLNQASDTADVSFLFKVITNNETVPVILTDGQGNILAWRNLDSVRATDNEGYLQQQLEEMRTSHDPIEIEVSEDQDNYIYYKESYLLTQLRYYPYIQLAIIGLFVFLGFLVFNTTRRAEQNKIWVGMAKETAHQLGTPISSLSSWVDYLKETEASSIERQEVLAEIEKDVNRLELTADRFAKIGSPPQLEVTDLLPSINKAIQYTRRRASNKVTIDLNSSYEELYALASPSLFEWVLENLLKNALDAIKGEGNINITLRDGEKEIMVDVTDSGHGIPKAKQQTIFQPGYSTKKRGWGLGLSLTKRIVDQYHHGKIFVKESAPDQGTTFRVVLSKGDKKQ